MDCFSSDESVIMTKHLQESLWRRDDLMVSALISRLSGLGLYPSQEHCVGQDSLLSQYFSPTKSINGKRRF